MARIAAIGLIDHDTIIHLDHLPFPGESASVSRITESPGGTTANTSVALVHLGEQVTLRGVVGDDARGNILREGLDRDGVGSQMITTGKEPTDNSMILLNTSSGERTILWQKGAAIRMGDQLDIANLFAHDIVILDMSDEPLRRFLTDLPAHTRPDVRLLGTLTYIVDNDEPDAQEIAFRFDTIAGSESQFFKLTKTCSLEGLIAFLHDRMLGNNLRAAVVTHGREGCTWITRDDHGHSPAFRMNVSSTIGAGDAFLAGIAYGMARRWSWPDTAQFANAVGALSTREVNAQSALPALDEVLQLIGKDT